MMAWVYLENPGADQKIVGKTRVSANHGYVLGVDGDQLYPEIWDAGGTRHVFLEGKIPAQTWTHLAVTWRSGGDMIGYINGEAVGRKETSDRPISTNDRPLIIGVAPWNTEQWRVEGRIDEVAILDWALKEADVKAICDCESGNVR